MEKKAYIAPIMNVHKIMIESMILSGTNTPNNLLNTESLRMGTQTALSKGYGGPIFDDEDYDDDELF